MNKAKQRAYFASLKNTKLLCWDCKQLKKVSKYILGGRVELECGHQRHTGRTKIQEVESKLDNTTNKNLFKAFADIDLKLEEDEENQ